MSDPGSRDDSTFKARRFRHVQCARALRIAVKPSRTGAARTPVEPSLRRRRGQMGAVQSPWRRLSTGTNHIVNFGLWRSGTRRAARRANRAGDTRWHRPYTEMSGAPDIARRRG